MIYIPHGNEIFSANHKMQAPCAQRWIFSDASVDLARKRHDSASIRPIVPASQLPHPLYCAYAHQIMQHGSGRNACEVGFSAVEQVDAQGHLARLREKKCGLKSLSLDFPSSRNQRHLSMQCNGRRNAQRRPRVARTPAIATLVLLLWRAAQEDQAARVGRRKQPRTERNKLVTASELSHELQACAFAWGGQGWLVG